VEVRWIRNTEKKRWTSSMPKRSVAGLISDYLKDHHFIKSMDQVLTPKGPGVPYVGFSDSGQAAVNVFYF
jgi:hypothetical protein